MQLQRLNTQEILILKMSCPTTNYVAAMFHPTIGHFSHQYLNNIATPELGMIPTRNKGTTKVLDIAKYTSKLIQAKHSWVYQAAREMEGLNC